MKRRNRVRTLPIIMFLAIVSSPSLVRAGDFEDWLASLTTFNANSDECLANKCRVNLAECLTHGDHCLQKGVDFTKKYCREKFQVCCENTNQVTECNELIDGISVPPGSVYQCRKSVCQKNFNSCMADCKNHCWNLSQELFCERRCREAPCREIYHVGPYPTDGAGGNLNETIK